MNEESRRTLLGSLPVDKMEGPYSARLPSSSIGEKSRRAPVGRETAEERERCSGATKSGESGLVTFSTNSTIAVLVRPSFHEGSGSAANAGRHSANKSSAAAPRSKRAR